jgi:DNA-binding CsgD family transcriptional regulator
MSNPASELIGRDRELAEAGVALDTAVSGKPQVLLVGGDAGIGKTSLVTAVAEDARARGFAVLVGHCLDIDDGVALRPVREALRPVVAGRAAEGLPPAVRKVAPYLSGESDSAGVDDLANAVAELVAEQPLLLVLEDLHWTDRSTIDFATAVARTATGRLCLVLTYRADEVNRRHRFHVALVELGRGPGAQRLDLRALDSRSITGIAHSRGVTDRELVLRVFERSEGNPLYAEELLAAGEDRMPQQLGSLLLARVDALSEPTRRMLRLASAHGSRLWPELLVEAGGFDRDALDAALREAIDAHVVERSAELLDFRHGLLREAVYDDLMPGEKAQAHRALAEALERMAGDAAGLPELGVLAYHWQAALDVDAAFRASLRAGRMAYEQGWVEGAGHLERALELYDRVPSEGRIHKADLLRMLAAVVEWGFDRERSRSLIAQALDLVEHTTDPLLAARVYTSYALRSMEIEGKPTHGEALERAVELLKERPSEELVMALSTQAGVHMRHERMAAADAALEHALEVATTLEVAREEADAWRVRGWCAMWLGDLPAAASYFGSSARVFRLGGMQGNALLSEIGLAMILNAGLDPARGLALAEDVQHRAQEAGADDTAAIAGLERAAGLINLGRLPEAEGVIEEVLASGGIPEDDYLCLVQRTRLLLMRGDAAGALAVERQRMKDFSPVASVPNYEWTLMHIQVLLANRLVAEALERSRDWLGLFAHSDGVPGRGPVVHGAYLAIEAGRRAALPGSEELMEQADRFLARYEGSLGVEAQRSFLGYSTPAAIALRAELHGEPSVELWRAAYDAAAHVGAGLALPLRLRLLAALLAAGERDEVRAAMPEMVADAKAMGALGMLDEALKLGRRHRIPVVGDDAPSRLDVLTLREREVLDVLATGATNRAIAEKLFISEKTVSVHVTNLMAKLGVSNRTEAASLAKDLGVLD